MGWLIKRCQKILEIEKNGGNLNATHTKKLSWGLSSVVEHLALVHEALGSVPSAEVAAVTTGTVHAAPRHGPAASALLTPNQGASQQVQMLLCSRVTEHAYCSWTCPGFITTLGETKQILSLLPLN